MSSRSESKKEAREARETAEREEAERQRRQRVWQIVGGSVLLAAIVVVVLIVISSSGSDTDTESSGDVALFDGIPQSGIELGDPKAPVTVSEFADPQCPFCKAYTADVMPGIVDKYVKTGDVRMELHLLTFIGPQSETVARSAYAASQQDLMWQFMDVAYARQGVENSGYVDQAWLDGVAEAAGVDVDEMNGAVNSADVSKQLADAKSAAADAGVSSTPTFVVGPTGEQGEAVDQDGLEAAIEKQLAAAK